MYSEDEELEFINSLYDDANEQMQEVYQEKKQDRDNLLVEIAKILLIYEIVDSVMDMARKEIKKEYAKFSKIINDFSGKQAKNTEKVMNTILNGTVKNTYDFYSYNAGLKDVQKIVDANFKGKHFSERIWDNEQETARVLHKKINNFLHGNINVNAIKKSIEKTFDTSAYNARRLVETEVNRCENEAFKRFCRETGVKKVRRNEVMDRKTCSICRPLDGKIYNLKDAPGPIHPCCRGYNTIEE
ncbi:minor capsid protein [Clostridium sp.]|uniref:minor capsid protein n=1 Tax=Clostridium sp. TaxID=1506 RepID=UPI003A28C768